MRLNENIQVPVGVSPSLARFLYDTLQGFARKVNGLADGKFYSLDGVGTAAPTSGTWAAGDFIRNSSPAELGSSGSKFVLLGWVCTTGGTPGTWKECRVLTGG